LFSAQKINSPYSSLYPDGLTRTSDGHFFILEEAIDWICQQVKSTDEPFLAYFHLYPPHEFYKPRIDYYDIFADDQLVFPGKPSHFFSENKTADELLAERQRYDEFVAFTDSEFGRLYHLLKNEGILDSSYLVVTSDHGQLFERGIHGHVTPTLYESLIRIPLIIRAPKQKQRVDVLNPTSTVDIAPTVNSISGQKIPDWFEGKILPGLGGENFTNRDVFIVEGKENAKTKPLTKATLGIISWPYKLVNYRGYPGFEDVVELFDLEKDPEELNDLAKSMPDIVSDLKKVLLDRLASFEKKSIGNL
jgi:arylsulfatase A-like enzyme